jgi:hypothetical protein
MPTMNGLHVPAPILILVAEITARHKAAHNGHFPPSHRFGGQDSDRASVGPPGHCEPCAVVGHVVAHPDYGCGDVRCNVDH